jgi:nitrate/TMAO reductase-like tetraheme cytochrome c subunit
MRFMPLMIGLTLAAAVSGRDLDPASSAEFCGRCHRTILEAWKRSAHARAMESPLFQDALEMAVEAYGAGTSQMCLSCHAPLAALTQDSSWRRKTTWEGVTCDYCHSVRSVALGAGNPKAAVELSLVKSGPLKDVLAPAHGAQYSPVHTSSLICAPCHEYRNALGFPVLTTYSEWEKSRYAGEGKGCPTCHMYQVAGAVADPKVAANSSAKLNLHEMPGSHSIDQLNRTIKAQLNAVREGDHLKVTVVIANVAAGHMVPTGSPMRQLLLEVTAAPYGGETLHERRAYRRVVADKQGKAVPREPDAFLRGASTLSDNRLAPDEKRTETFLFPIGGRAQVQVTAAVSYYYSPLAEGEAQRRMTFLTLRRLVK